MSIAMYQCTKLSRQNLFEKKLFIFLVKRKMNFTLGTSVNKNYFFFNNVFLFFSNIFLVHMVHKAIAIFLKLGIFIGTTICTIGTGLCL